jgi:hypothetical protein
MKTGDVSSKIQLEIFRRYPLSFSPRGAKKKEHLPPWGKAGKGVNVK